ncbi:MAG: fucose-binding protein [Actinobacteria bacterium]|nr:fucose-binding protein [Actinomycetota bacterium]
MLKGLDPLLVPDLLVALAAMGHGDTVAIVDRNFPAHSHGGRVVELPTTRVQDALAAVLSVLPLDRYDGPAVRHMLTDEAEESPATADARVLWRRAEGMEVSESGLCRHDGFYAAASDAFVTVRTGETLPFACYLLRKGTL